MSKNMKPAAAEAAMKKVADAVDKHVAEILKAGAILHRTQGDFIHYAIDVTGGNAQWVLSCRHRSQIQASDPMHPQGHYDVDLRIPDTDATDDIYAMGFLFIGAPQYHVVIDHRDAAGNVIEVLQDRTLTGKDDDPPQFATLHVFVV